MALELAAVLALAQRCGPGVAPETLLSVAHVESGFDPLAIGVNGPGARQLRPGTVDEAVRQAASLIAAGRSIDLGIAQINSKNLSWLGLSIADAFDPCRNLAASAKVLQDGYARAAPRQGAEQAGLRTAFSYYNTGDASRGFRNGYVTKVTAAATYVVPAIAAFPAVANEAPPETSVSPAPAPPTWDVFGRAAAASPRSGFVFSPNNGERQ